MKKLYATVRRGALVAILLSGAAMQAQAITITTTESRYEPSGVRYYFTANWTPSESGINPCTSNDPVHTVCRVELAAKPSPYAYFSLGYYPADWTVPIRRGGSDISYLLSDLKKVGFSVPIYGSILVPYESVNKYNDICIAFTYVRLGTNLGGVAETFGPCATVATPPLQCNITGKTTINHYTLSDNDVDGAKASTLLDVQCRGVAIVRVSASRTNSSGVKLTTDGSLYSKVTINGKDATNGINLFVTDSQPSRLDILSTLSSSKTVTPGPFSGSTVITISPN